MQGTRLTVSNALKQIQEFDTFNQMYHLMRVHIVLANFQKCELLIEAADLKTQITHQEWTSPIDNC